MQIEFDDSGIICIQILFTFFSGFFFHLYGDVIIAGEGLQNLGLCSAVRAFEQEYRHVPHLL
jgi:hypothetical protein